MATEARLEPTESGLKPVSEGWFVVNVGETGWAVHDAFGRVVEGRLQSLDPFELAQQRLAELRARKENR